MRKTLLTLIILLTALPVLEAQECRGGILAESPLHPGVELSSKYLWRGIEYGTAPVIFPSLGLSLGNFYAYGMGAYAFDGSHQEVDFGASYTWKNLTLALNDYYYPTAVGEKDDYFNLKSRETGHYLEAVLSYTMQKIPLRALVSAYVAGADKNPDGDQAYSSYAEVGTWIDFAGDHRLSLDLGVALNKSFYTWYEKSLRMVNITTSYTYNARPGGFLLPLRFSWVVNPYLEKTYVSASAIIAF